LAIGGPETIARVPDDWSCDVAASILKDVLVNVQQQTPGNLRRVLVDLVKLIKASAPPCANALPTDIVCVHRRKLGCLYRPLD